MIRRAVVVVTVVLATASTPAAADLTASFTFTPATPVVGQVVTFDASKSAGDRGGVCCYRWHFGDLTRHADNRATARHTFAAPGIYVVVLTVSGPVSSGPPATVSESVSVTPAPSGSLRPQPTTCDEYGLKLPSAAGGDTYEDAVQVHRHSGQTCLSAAQLADRVDAPYYSRHPPPTRIRGNGRAYRCRIVPRGSNALKGQCASGAHVVTWSSHHALI